MVFNVKVWGFDIYFSIKLVEVLMGNFGRNFIFNLCIFGGVIGNSLMEEFLGWFKGFYFMLSI